MAATGHHRGMSDGPWLKGRLLVAGPTLADPNFFRTVLLLLEHNEDGALGVVLNRPSEADLDDSLPEWAHLAAHPPVVFVGGPVAPGAAICLGRVQGGIETEAWQPVVGPVGILDLNHEPEELAPPPEEIRVFAGYAGWSPGQLEGEIEEGGWFVLDAEPDDALSPVPEGLWRLVLRRQGGDLAMMANFPTNPSLN